MRKAMELRKGDVILVDLGYGQGKDMEPVTVVGFHPWLVTADMRVRDRLGCVLDIIVDADSEFELASA